MSVLHAGRDVYFYIYCWNCGGLFVWSAIKHTHNPSPPDSRETLQVQGSQFIYENYNYELLSLT